MNTALVGMAYFLIGGSSMLLLMGGFVYALGRHDHDAEWRFMGKLLCALGVASIVVAAALIYFTGR